jgi:hypothetical protein
MLSQVMSRHSKVSICLGLVVIVVLAIREQPGSNEARSVMEELTSTLGGSEEIAFGQSLFQVM